METKEEELPKKKELLSDEELLKVAAGGLTLLDPRRKSICSKKCSNEKNYGECVQRCLKAG